MSSPGSNSVFNGKKIKPVKKGCLPGESKTSEIIACLNTLLFWRITMVDGGQSGKVVLDDKGAVLELPRGGSAAGGGGLYAAGVYSTAVDYIPGAIVYTSPDSSTRYLWICELANGPSSALQAPTWTEPGTVYWRCYARGGTGGGLVQCKITSSGPNNYFGVTKWDNSGYVGSEFLTAKSIPGRMPASDTVEGASFAYDYTSSGGDENHRTSSDGTNTEFQVMFQRYVVGAIVYVIPVDYSGVSVSDVDLKFIEVNTAREWVKKYIPS